MMLIGYRIEECGGKYRIYTYTYLPYGGTSTRFYHYYTGLVNKTAQLSTYSAALRLLQLHFIHAVQYNQWAFIGNIDDLHRKEGQLYRIDMPKNAIHAHKRVKNGRTTYKLRAKDLEL